MKHYQCNIWNITCDNAHVWIKDAYAHVMQVYNASLTPRVLQVAKFLTIQRGGDLNDYIQLGKACVTHLYDPNQRIAWVTVRSMQRWV
jgi:hypothetical protein